MSIYQNRELHLYFIAVFRLKQITQDIGTIFFDYYVNPLKELKATESELHLLSLIGLFTPLPSLSKEGGKKVMATKLFYVNVLQKTIKLQNPTMTESEIAERLGSMLGLLPMLEVKSH